MIELVENKNHNVIKRSGNMERYRPDKMYNVLMWACDDNETLAKELLKSIDIKVYDKISIARLFDEVIGAAADKINEMFPVWDTVAKKLLVQKIYKEVWEIKRSEYPAYIDVLRKGIQYGVYNKAIIDTFSEEELIQLNDFINPEKDFKFTFGGLNLFMQKYTKKYTKKRHLELPQHAMLRVAIQLHYNDHPSTRMQNIKMKYDLISNHIIVIPTPLYLNAMAMVFNPTSCVLIQPDDDAESINETSRSMAIYSKNGSGLGVDITRIRATGSTIGKSGTSSGPVPFIQLYEKIVQSFNQQSARVGAAAIYYPWWHKDSPEIIMLKDAGGQDSERARALKYGIKWNRYFTMMVLLDQEVYLFDPKDTPDLIEATGDEFNRLYKMYKERADKRSISVRKIKARELAFMYLKVYGETGNNYWMSSDNANKFKVAAGHINMSNLCTEILLATAPLKMKSSNLIEDKSTSEYIEKREYSGEIGICNLTNINIIAWDNMTPNEKDAAAYSILLGMDNAIETSTYPVKAGETFNKKHRALGIGLTNYHNWLAQNKIKLSSDEAKKLTHEITESIAFYLTKNSIELAKERGRYDYFEGSLWSRGIFQHELYNDHFSKIYRSDLNFKNKMPWDDLRSDMIKYGVRFENLMAVAPGACQVKENKIRTGKGIQTIEDILIDQNIDYKNIEENEKIGWYDFENPISIPTRFGAKESKKIWFNGHKPVYEIEFEDGKIYKFTGNHQLLVNRNDEKLWVRVDEIQEGDDIVEMD
jgi:ribonucleoside-diphosphate reductase alpha chain